MRRWARLSWLQKYAVILESECQGQFRGKDLRILANWAVIEFELSQPPCAYTVLGILRAKDEIDRKLMVHTVHELRRLPSKMMTLRSKWCSG